MKKKKSIFGAIFGLFKTDNTSKNKKMASLIENDPVLKKLDADIAKIHQTYGQLDPEYKAILKKYGAL